MVVSTHDFTDSEGESDGTRPVHPASEPIESASGIYTREASAGSMLSPPRAGPSNENHPLRFTLRPNLNHLVNSDSHVEASHQHSDRSSLSPPPPITFRLPMKQAVADKVAYSSSSSDEDDDGPSSKKARTKIHPPPVDGTSSTHLPAQHRKSYEWLQPSLAAASHHGPPERSMPKITGWSPTDEEGTDAKTKKSHKRRPEGAPAGPGKAWRKGLKKGMPMPWRGGGPFLGDVWNGPSHPTPSGHTTSLSLEGTPDSGTELNPGERPPTPPFILAEPAKLGFPVFSKPVVAPHVNLGPFPKVTQFFAPNNGGDAGAFPRKERVRTWKHSNRTIVGVGGGRLRFKTWTKGSPSELARLILADKEAKEISRQKPKAALPADMGLPPGFTTAPWDRPPLVRSHSFESAAQDLQIEEPEDGGASEVGDGEDSVAGSVREGGIPPSKGRGIKAGKAKPRKSKLAQEIHPISGSSSTAEPVM